MNIPSEIFPREFLGREVLSSRIAKRLKKAEGYIQNLPAALFIPIVASPTISVDRLLGDLEILTAIGDANAAMRNDGVRIFYGWAYCRASDAARNGREVVASPRTLHPVNPYHADICLPGATAEFYSSNLDIWTEHVESMIKDLKGRVRWLGRHNKSQ